MQTARKEPRLVHNAPETHPHAKRQPYYKLAAMIGAHFVVMYLVMYSMVHTFADVFLNWNNFYMTAAMAAPMAALMLLFMKDMYRDRRWNIAIYAAAVALTALFVLFTRQQTFIGDEQFIKSMIPHHSGAILMCEKASIADAELKTLCTKIIAGQQEEIDQMNAILARLQGR